MTLKELGFPDTLKVSDLVFGALQQAYGHNVYIEGSKRQKRVIIHDEDGNAKAWDILVIRRADKDERAIPKGPDYEAAYREIAAGVAAAKSLLRQSHDVIAQQALAELDGEPLEASPDPTPEPPMIMAPLPRWITDQYPDTPELRAVLQSWVETGKMSDVSHLRRHP